MGSIIKYSSEDLAFYNKGNQFPSILINNISSAISKVFFPAMVERKNDYQSLKAFLRKSSSMSSYLLFPLVAGFMAVARPFVIVLLTEKWLPAVQYIRIMCLFWALQPLQTINWQVIKAIGRSDLCVKLEIIKKIIGIALVLISMWFGVTAIAWSSVLFAMISAYINMRPVHRLVGYTYWEQIKDILPSLLLSVFMGGCVFFVSFIDLPIPAGVTLLVQVVLGIVIYWLLSQVFKVPEFLQVKEMITSKINGMKRKHNSRT